MKMKINLVLAFALFLAINGFSQDPVNAPKTLHAISAKEIKPRDCNSPENKSVQAETKSVHSCEINKNKKEAVVSTKQADGSITKEKFELKEVKK